MNEEAYTWYFYIRSAVRIFPTLGAIKTKQQQQTTVMYVATGDHEKTKTNYFDRHFCGASELMQCDSM